jgi:hypothetical protein
LVTEFSGDEVTVTAVDQGGPVVAGLGVLSEREIEARERAEGRRVFSAECRGGRHHRPDLILLGDSPEAIEVELSAKSARRLDEIMRAWWRSLGREQFSKVRYRCSAPVLPYLKRPWRGPEPMG